MKITIYEPKESEEKEKELCLRLTRVHEVVELRAVDPVDGVLVDCGIILTVDRDGIHIHGGVDKSLGLPLAPGGYVRVSDSP